jgi:hypothetical protein
MNPSARAHFLISKIKKARFKPVNPDALNLQGIFGLSSISEK